MRWVCEGVSILYLLRNSVGMDVWEALGTSIHRFCIKRFLVLKSGSKVMMQRNFKDSFRKEMRSTVSTSVTLGNYETPGPVFGRRTSGVWIRYTAYWNSETVPVRERLQIPEGQGRRSFCQPGLAIRCSVVLRQTLTSHSSFINPVSPFLRLGFGPEVSTVVIHHFLHACQICMCIKLHLPH
jgi:hypothetical protein